MRALITRLLPILVLVLGIASAANAADPIRIQVFGKSTVANNAGYGTIADCFQAFDATTGARLPLGAATWSENNDLFYMDHFGCLHNAWNSLIVPGPQGMQISASASGYTAASIPLTIQVTGTTAPQEMTVTVTPVAPAYVNSPPATIIEQMVLTQTATGFLGNLQANVTWTSDNPNFQVLNTPPNTNAGTFYLQTTWNGTIAAGPQIVNLLVSAPDYVTKEVTLTIQVLAPPS
jgi:hypothetical protein